MWVQTDLVVGIHVGKPDHSVLSDNENGRYGQEVMRLARAFVQVDRVRFLRQLLAAAKRVPVSIERGGLLVAGRRGNGWLA